MPELPEVETTRQGIAPHLTGQTVTRVVVRERRLRWPVSPELETVLGDQVINAVERRGKYLLLRTEHGSALLHLGMSGSLRLLPQQAPLRKHDHADIDLASGYTLRLNDPRRFGALLWVPNPPESHPLLRALGPEPLGNDFTAAYLHQSARNRTTPVKLFIMNGHIVVGIGNIYANEALFAAGIDPARAAGRIALAHYEVLVQAIREVLSAAIARGGTTLRDFVNGDGEAGYFQNDLRVYDRDRQPCLVCGEPIRLGRLGQRATYSCPRCQR